MSGVEDSISALNHMDSSIAAMRKAMAAIRADNEGIHAVLVNIWGGGNDLAGPLAKEFADVEQKLSAADLNLFTAQIEIATATVLLVKIRG